MQKDKPDAPTPPTKEDIREDYKERPDFYDVDPNGPEPGTSDPRAPGRSN